MFPARRRSAKVFRECRRPFAQLFQFRLVRQCRRAVSIAAAVGQCHREFVVRRALRSIRVAAGYLHVVISQRRAVIYRPVDLYHHKGIEMAKRVRVELTLEAVWPPERAELRRAAMELREQLGEVQLEVLQELAEQLVDLRLADMMDLTQSIGPIRSLK